MASVPTTSPALVPGARLLVVDDERLVRLVAREVLLRAGFAVQEAADGAAALEIVRTGVPVDLILLDLTMPGLSGLETFRGLRALRPEVPVVLTSGYGGPEMLAPFGVDGLAGFVQKPFTAAALVRAIQAAVRTGEVTAT